MIKIVLLLTFFLSFGNPSEKKNEYRKEYYQTGEVKSQYWLKNGAETGYWRFYHHNGKLSEKGHYTNGKWSSYWYFFAKNGKLQEEGHYANGAKVKRWLFYDLLGKVSHKCQLSDGKKNGYCIIYKNNNMVEAEKHQDGKRIMAWSSFSGFKEENKLSDLR